MKADFIIAYIIIACQVAIITIYCIWTLPITTLISSHALAKANSYTLTYNDNVSLYWWDNLVTHKLNAAGKLAMQKNAPVADVSALEYAVIVDISEQREYIFNKGKYIAFYIVSTGGLLPTSYDSHMYPNVWKINKKQMKNLSSIYGPCLLLMGVWKDNTWVSTSRALHGTDTPDIIGMPMSLGCVYHYSSDILELCDILDIGDYVYTIE